MRVRHSLGHPQAASRTQDGLLFCPHCLARALGGGKRKVVFSGPQRVTRVASVLSSWPVGPCQGAPPLPSLSPSRQTDIWCPRANLRLCPAEGQDPESPAQLQTSERETQTHSCAFLRSAKPRHLPGPLPGLHTELPTWLDWIPGRPSQAGLVLHDNRLQLS